MGWGLKLLLILIDLHVLILQLQLLEVIDKILEFFGFIVDPIKLSERYLFG